MWPDRVSNPGPLIYKSGALPTAIRGPAQVEYSAVVVIVKIKLMQHFTYHCYNGALMI